MTAKSLIKRHEGFNSRPYKCTAGKLTIGWGRNIEDNGISVQEAEFLLDNDILRCQLDLYKYRWYLDQPYDVQIALLDMCFNMGINKLICFKKMIKALEDKDYTVAAMEALDSKWAKQVGDRAKTIAVMIREANHAK